MISCKEKVTKIVNNMALIGYFLNNKLLTKWFRIFFCREMNQPCQFLDFFDGHDIWYQSQFSVPIKKKYGIMDVCLSLPLIKVILTKFICRHFLGAAGVFFAFLCIFTLDEDVRNQRRDSIRVF